MDDKLVRQLSMKTPITVRYYLRTQKTIKLKLKFPDLKESFLAIQHHLTRLKKRYFKVSQQTSESYVSVGLSIMLLHNTLTFVMQRGCAVGLSQLHPST